MRAWCESFGKPLLCVIAGPKAIIGYKFSNQVARPVQLSCVECFPRGLLIGVSVDAK
jgi:hypothetical protein